MARVKFNVSKAFGRLRRKINKATQDPRLEKDIGDFLVDRVGTQVRKGKPLNDTGTLPKLEKSTKKRRKAYKGPKHPAFKPGKSHLTLTGQLVNAISFKRSKGIFSGRSGLFRLFVDKSPRDGSKLRNNQVAEALTKGVITKHGEIKQFIMFTVKGLKRDKKITGRIKQKLLRFLRKQLEAEETSRGTVKV